ncbi:MAG: hypothetical protein IPM84_20060 [Anaerolineae bacterium]|nr:hypothetical protein [Anaerolineae bacterium]
MCSECSISPGKDGDHEHDDKIHAAAIHLAAPGCPRRAHCLYSGDLPHVDIQRRFAVCGGRAASNRTHPGSRWPAGDLRRPRRFSAGVEKTAPGAVVVSSSAPLAYASTWADGVRAAAVVGGIPATARPLPTQPAAAQSAAPQGYIVRNANPDGPDSLYAAIYLANANPGHDDITFAIDPPGRTRFSCRGRGCRSSPIR